MAEEPEQRRVYEYGLAGKDYMAAINTLSDWLQSGENVLVTTDTLRSAEALLRAVLKMSEYRRFFDFLIITSKTNGNKDVRRFLEDPNAEARNYQLIIASPSISSGISITDPHFTRHMHIYHGQIPPRESIQQSARDRTARNILVLLGKEIPVGRYDSLQHLHGLRQIEGERVGDQPQNISVDAFSELRAKVCHARSQHCQNPQNALIHQIIDLGYEVRRRSPNESDDDKDEDQNLFLSRYEECEKVCHAENLTESEYEALRCKSERTQEEAMAAKRYRMQRALGLEIKIMDPSNPAQEIDYEAAGLTPPRSPELASLVPAGDLFVKKAGPENGELCDDFDWQRRFGERSLRRMEEVRSPQLVADKDGSQHLDRALIRRKHAKQTSKFFSNLFDKLNVDFNRGWGVFTDTELENVKRWMLDERFFDHTGLDLGYTIPARYRKNRDGKEWIDYEAIEGSLRTIDMVRQLLKSVGLKVKWDKSAKTGSVDPESWKQLTRYLRQRARLPENKLPLHVLFKPLISTTELAPVAAKKPTSADSQLLDLLLRHEVVPLSTKWIQTHCECSETWARSLKKHLTVAAENNDLLSLVPYKRPRRADRDFAVCRRGLGTDTVKLALENELGAEVQLLPGS